MSEDEKPTTKYVLFDSVISLSLVTENMEKKRTQYLMRLESLDETIHLRKCNPLSDFCLIKESLFVIRHMRENAVDESVPNTSSPGDQSTEVNYNQHFILQHMVSKKFLSKDKLQGNNNYQLKLVDNENFAIPFTFKKIVDTRSTQNRIQFNQIIYLSVYIKEKAQYYYVNQLGPKSRLNNEYSEVIIEKDFTNKFVIINQGCYGNDDGCLYSGDLINIIFQEKQQLNEKCYMIGVECQKEVKTGELISLKEEVKEDIDNFVKDNGQQGNDMLDMKIDFKNDHGNKCVKSYNLKNELFQHINHFSFWIIEEESFSSLSKIQRSPLTAESFVRIKNPILNMYLKIKKKPPIEGMADTQDEYEFELCEEKNLSTNLLFLSNFQIFHYSINAENKNLTDGGKYVIKSIFKEFKLNDPDNHFDINSINSYFEPISLSPSSDDKLTVKKGEEFVFEIRKINIYKGNEAIYLKRIIEQLDYLVKSYNKKCYNQSNVIDVISHHLTFFTNYLMNLDYSFKDINLESNYPVPSRQNLLRKFKILDIITQIIYYFLPSVRQQKDKKDMNNKNDQTNLGLKALMKQILTFLTNLSQDNEKIKQEIFVGMKNILDLCEYLFQKDRTILLDFIFVILKGSNALQECVLGSTTMLVNSFKNRKQILTSAEKENLIHIDKIFSYLETSQNYLYFYKKIISFDKVTYKKDEIFKKIKEHMRKVEDDYNRDKTIRNYKTILNKRIAKIKKILKDPDLQGPQTEEELGPDMNNDDSEEKENFLPIINDILYFLKFFKKFDFNSSLFLKEDFLSQITNKNTDHVNNNDYLDKKLQFIINQNIKPEKFIGDLDIDVKSQLAPIMPLHFFNEFFPKVGENELSDDSSDEEDDVVVNTSTFTRNKKKSSTNLNFAQTSTFKTQKKQFGSNLNLTNIGGMNDNNDPPLSKKNTMVNKTPNESNTNLKNVNSAVISNNNDLNNSQLNKNIKNNNDNKNALIKKRQKELKVKLHKYLCIVYSTYQFCINQFFESVYVVYKTLKNICVNYDTFGDVLLIKEYLEFIRTKLLSKVKFIDDSIIKTLYENAIKDPTVLMKSFDINENDVTYNTNLISNEEIYNVKFLFKFCRNYDKINLFLEKIKILSEIRQQLIIPPDDAKTLLGDSILKNLNSKRLRMLSLYQSLNREKEKLISGGIFNTNSIRAYSIQKRIKFVTNLLGKLDTSHYFDKIIYIKNEELLSHLKASSYEIKNIKSQIEKVHNQNDTAITQRQNDIEADNTTSIKNIIYSLDEISRQFRTIFNEQKKEFTMKDKSGTSANLFSNPIEKLLLQEDASYFRKIDFPDTLNKMIHVINSFSHLDKANTLKLEYCKEILKIFKSMSKNYSKFNKLIMSEVNVYIDLIVKSLETVKNYISDKYNDKENEKINLSILYNSAIAFLYLVENSKIPFAELKNHMTKIFKLFLDIYQDLPPELKVLYHIFYTYLVSRVLLFLNKEKAYDFYYYEMFYQSIFPLKEIRGRVIDSIRQLNIDSATDEEDEMLSEVNSIDKKSDEENEDEEEQEESAEIEEKTEKLIYLNFLTIYVIYLNELNSVRQSVSTDKSALPSFKFKNLSEKIKLVLDTSIKISDEQFNINKNDSLVEGRDSIVRNTGTQFGTNQFKILNQFSTNNLQSNMSVSNNDDDNFKFKSQKMKTIRNEVFNDYEFESILLQSIIHYKLEKKILEICITKENRYKFYYYDTDFIDILLIEKVLRDIEIGNYIRSIFEEDAAQATKSLASNQSGDSTEGLKTPLNVLKQYRIEFNVMMSYATQEEIYHDILHSQYIKNDMIKYLNNIVKSFNEGDSKAIAAMKYFNYVKMNEMYPENFSDTVESEASKSLMEELLELDEKNQSEISPTFHEYYYINKEDSDGELGIDLNKIFSAIMYLYPQYNKRLTILIYKSSFNLLLRKCGELRNRNNYTGNIENKNDLNFEEVITCLIGLFKREINQEIILDKSLFFVVLNSITTMLKLLQKERMSFVIKNSELLRTWFMYFDFIFNHLAKNLESIVKFMKNPESQKISDKFIKKVEKLKKIIKFITNVLKFNSIKDVNILTEKIKMFNSKIVEQIIKLIFILLEFNNSNSNPTILLLIDFINNFIQGPDIENLNLLFSQGYFDLMKYVIKNIDYYQIFLNNINKKTLYDSLDNMIEIEYKIMKIFFVYFNIAHNNKKDLSNYIKVRKFYEENFENIKNKLKRIYYISQRENEGRKFDIDKMLLYYNGNDFYTEEDLFIRAGATEEAVVEDSNSSKADDDTQLLQNKLVDRHNKSHRDVPILTLKSKENFLIKFEIILIYYTLYIQQKEVMFENYFNVTSTKKAFYEEIMEFFIKLFFFILDIILSPYYLVLYVMDCCKEKRTKVSLFEKLYDIEEKYLKISENEMMEFMKTNITSVEVCMNDIVYKLYFPILTKSKKIKENPSNYIQVESNQLQNYIYHVLNNYDNINIEATQNHKIDKILEVPIIRFIFLNMDLFKTLSLCSALITNFLILVSYSDFNEKLGCKDGTPARLNCPYLWYHGNQKNLDKTNKLFWAFGLAQVIITIFLFLNYYMRKFATQLSKTENRFKLQQIKKKKTRRLRYGCCHKVNYIILPTIFNSFVNFESLFYILALGFSIIGITIHHFFYGFMLVELVVRIKVMRNVLLAMYVPRRQIIITLIMFLILIYYFSIFALTFFNSHFPISDDTMNLGKTFMRMFDQTFKQDGGVGTYLQQSNDPVYVPYIPRAFVGLRFWYDNIFTYVILILIFQMFLSIIKDYFSSQREDQETFAETIEKICLICGIERETLEKIYSNHKNAFEIHINHDHNVSNYICYLNYLQCITKRDKIVEENVWQYHLRNNYLFLPKNTCFKLRERKNLESSSLNNSTKEDNEKINDVD